MGTSTGLYDLKIQSFGNGGIKKFEELPLNLAFFVIEMTCSSGVPFLKMSLNLKPEFIIIFFLF